MPSSPSDAPKDDILPPLTKLDGLFNHLASSFGHYSKETFASLYSSLTKLIREQHLSGLVMTRTLNDPDFLPMVTALANRDTIALHTFDDTDHHSALPASCGINQRTGFVIILTNRLCACLFWTVDARQSFQQYQGGWTFHPGDTKTIATHFIAHFEASQPERFQTLSHTLEETPIDRRYDEKLNLLVRSLVNGLEQQSQDLANALAEVQQLNKKMVDQERLAAIGQLCSVVAHEIRNPLGLIDLYAKLIETQLNQLSTDDSTQKEGLNKNIDLIRQSIESLDSILSELTQYSRPLQLERNDTDITQLVNDVCTFYQPSYTEKEVSLTINPIKVKLPSLFLDRGRIRQALINLLKNALEVSKAGQTVSVTVASRQNDDKVFIKVTDEGPGITEQTQEKLFTPYFSTKRNGTGLGLAHSRKILQAHGGSVELLTTKPGLGSTFALILPTTAPEEAFYNPLMSSNTAHPTNNVL